MILGKLSKAIARRLTVSWREQLTQTDIDALEANIVRVGLVVHVRWAIVASLVVFSVAAALAYESAGSLGATWRYMIVPAVALASVLVYNTFYELNYRRFGNLAAFNVVQLVADILVVTLLIYYSGGVYSWFTSMYLLFVLEAALILPTPRQAWAITGTAMVAYAALLSSIYFGLLPHRPMPFVANDLQGIGSYVAVRAMWELTVLAGATGVGTALMRTQRSREERLATESVRDTRTGLFTRAHFRGELTLDIERANRYRRGVSVVIMDIDGLAAFNATFGFDAGNAMIVGVADVIRASLAAGRYELVSVARYGGEEFALVVPEDAPGETAQGGPLAETLRAAVGDLRIDDRSVTVSVGVATYPTHGRTAPELIAAADSALAAAYLAGGNRCVTAGAAAERGTDQ